MQDTFPMHGSNWGKYIKDVTKYDLNMVKAAIKKLTDTLEKHMHQC